MSFIVDAITDVIDWVAGAIEDVVDFVFDEIVEPVVSFVGDTVQALLDNPIETIAKVVAIATGNAWAIPLIDGASVAANGGDLGDVLKTVAVSYVSQAIGGEVAQHTAPFVDEFIGEALSEGVKELAVSAITQGTVAATQAIIYGEDPLEAFARGGITAAVSAGLGKIGEQMGWEMEVTDPDTGQTTTRPIPNVVKNMIGSALAAELTGQEITPELMANAVTRGLITTQLVRDYIVTNPEVGDREISYITAAFQRTAAVALSGGTGEEAAAQIMGVLSAYGMEELHDEIRDSGVGDFIGDTLDRISGDYQRVEELTALMDEIGPRLTENYAEYKEKYDTLNELWNTITGNRDQIMQMRGDAAEEGGSGFMTDRIAALEAEIETAVTEYNRLVTDEGYLDRINELVPLIEADNEALQGYQDDLIVAQNDLQREADRLDGELTSVYNSTDAFLVNAMDPGFNAEQYRALNNIPDDVDPYTHFLAEGQHNGAYTSIAQYSAAMKEYENTLTTSIIWGGFGVGDNSLARNLTQADRDALASIITQRYGINTPQELEAILASTEAQEQIFNEWVEAIGSDPNNTYRTGQALSANDLATLDRLGYDIRGVAEGTEMTAQEALALDQALRSENDEGNESTIELGDGVTAGDVVSGEARLTYTATGVEWQMPEEMRRWDPQAGWITRRLQVNTAGEPVGYEWVDKDGRTDTNIQPAEIIVTRGNDSYMTEEEQADIVFTAVQEGTTWDEVQEGMGWTDSLISMAQNMFDSLDEGNYDTTTNFLANAMKAGGGILDAFNGMSTLFGIAPDSTALGKFAQQLQDVGAANNTEEYKEELSKLEAMMNAESDLPEDAAWYERAFDKVATIAGAAATHPSAFISEYIGVEALQELVPLAIGGVATLGAKGAAMAMGRTLSTRMAAGTGLTAAAITDITESYGGSASEAYDRALNVALDSTNPETGRLFTQEEAESYAMTVAVQTGTVAATLTAATMGIGGMALEKAILGDRAATGFVADGINELASRAANGATIMIKEGLTEALEEGLATAYREGTLSQIDPTIDVSSEVAGAAFMGFLVGGPVSGGAYGVSQVGDMYSNFISAVDPNVREAIDSGDVEAANAALDDLGVTDEVIRTNILSQVQPDNYVNQAESTEAFVNANPDYTPTEAEINEFVQQGGQSELDANIDRYVDDRYVDVQEVIAAAAEQGVTLTEEEAQEYVGQGPAGHEAAVLAQLGQQLGPGYTSEGEARAMFEALGYTPTDAEVAAYVGNVAESTQEAAIGAYVDPRQVNSAEAQALFEAQGFSPSTEDIAAFVGQGGANFEASADVTSYVDPRQVTTAEAEAFFDGLGYDATAEQIAQFAGQGTATFETDQGSAISTFVDPRMVTEAEARAAFEAQGYTPTDAEVAQYVAQGTSANTQTNAESDITSFADPRATTEAEVRAMFDAQGYTPTDAEVSARIAQGNDTHESDMGTAVVGYVDPRQVTEAEARQFFADQGYTPSDAEVQAYMGQGGNGFETGQDSAVGTYVDPRQVTEAEARQFFADQGYTPSDAEVQAYMGQGGEDFASNQGTAVGTYVDPRQMSEAEARAALVAQGIPEPTDDQIAGLMGQGDEDFETTQQEYAVEYADPFVTTYDEAKQFFNDLGFTPTRDEIEAYVGATSEAEQQEAIAAFVDPRYTDADEAREFLTALGYDPTDEEVARFTGQVNEEQQEEAIGEYVDPRMVDAEEVAAAYEALGLQQPTEADIQELVGQYMESELAGRAEEYLPTARYNSIMDILNNFSGVGGLSEAEQAALDLVKADIIAAMGDLGLEVAAIDDAVNDLTDAVGAVASGEEDATGLYSYIDQAIADLKAAGLTNEEVEAAITDIVGNPATTDEEGNEVAATGIYATLADLGTSIDGLNDLSTEDVNTIVSNALSELNDLSAEDVTKLITDALTGLNDLSTEDVETIVSNALSGIENLSSEDVETVVNNIIGSPATEDAAATGIYALVSNLNDLSTEDVQTVVTEALSGLENLSTADVETVVENLVGTPATDDAEATGVYSLISDLNNISEEDVETIVNDIVDDLNNLGTDDVESIVADAIGDLENISEEDVQGVVNDIVGGPATDDADATGIYAIIDGLNNLSDDDVSNIVADIVGQPATEDSPATGLYATIGDLNNISEEDVTAIVTEALGGLENISADDVSTIVDGIIGSPATDDEDASGIYGYVDNTTDEILDILGNPATDDEDATGVYGYIDDAVDNLGTDLAALAGNVGTPAELDADGNVVTPATGIYAQVQDLMDQGLTNAEAIASLAVEFGVAVTDLTNLINAQTDTITEDVGEVAEDVEGISGLLGQPAIADNPLTEEDESADPTGLFGIIAGYETAGQERDEAINSALDDLATQLGTTKTDILDQLDLGLDQIETLITNSQTAVEEQIDKAVEDIGIDLGEMETEILEKMAEYEADGIDRDDALALAISDVSTQLGETETDILDALASTESDILTELGTTEADILAALAETETTLASDIDAVSNLVGKPATEVTQTDIDFVVDVIAGQQVIDENQQDLLAQYDVTGDGQITLDDQTLLEQLLAGEQVYDQIADTSIYAPTGTYGAISDAQTDLTNQMDQNQDQTMDAITEMEQNIVTNIEDEALRAGGRQFLQQALQAPDAMGQQVTVRQADPLNLRYIYDFNSIFANPQQAGMFPSPYAKGGQVDDTTDKLLNIIGGS